jgi:hypothetical protein
LYLARVSLRLEEYADAELYGRRALACARAAAGPDSIEAAIAGDELAVTLAFCATRQDDSKRAEESLSLSADAFRTFRNAQGPDGKEAARSAENHVKLRAMLAALVPDMPAADAGVSARPLALQTYPFISHAYADHASVDLLLQSLPPYVKPVVFEAITAPPSEWVSNKLVSGLLGADGFIAIDSAASNSSFWTTFERDLAARNQKAMYRFDPGTGEITEFKVQPRKLWFPYLCHPDDAADVSKVLGWLAAERSFETFDDPGEPGRKPLPPLSAMEVTQRDMYLFGLRTFGAVYLIFLSQRLVSDADLLAHVDEQARTHPSSTMMCWLDPPDRIRGPAALDGLKKIPRELAYAFSARPLAPTFNLHELDDLMVRLYWLLYQGRPGDWSR